MIGVGALVAILSLGDSLEQYGREQLSTTTSLEAIVITSKTTQMIDGISMRRDSIAFITLDHTNRLTNLLGDDAEVVLRHRSNTEIRTLDDSVKAGAILYATQPIIFDMMDVEPQAGQLFDAAAMKDAAASLVLSYSLALRLANGNSVASLIDQTIQVGSNKARVVGILEGTDSTATPEAYGPYSFWNNPSDPDGSPPVLVARAREIELVNPVKARIQNWLDTHVEQGSGAFSISTNQMRVAQMERGVRVFKIVMGLITGVAVIVGGIGVMNVLLISIAERTREIGVRKATGARRRDIVLQFLTEAITISMVGSIFGILLGLSFMAVALPIVKQFADTPFEVTFSWASLGIVCIVAIFVGIGFGTYPASRAANLSPIDAIRYE